MIDIEKYWQAVLAQDAQAIRAFFAPFALVSWHNTNERFTVEEFIRANCEYPGDWTGRVEKVVKAGDTIITATRVQRTDGRLVCHAVSFIRESEGRIVSIDEYWGDDGEAPAWRQEMHLGSAIVLDE